MKHYVYIAQCADTTLYVGYTNDIGRRIVEHNTSKRAAQYTKSRRPIILKYSESFRTRRAALKREYKIKQLTRQEKLEIINTK